jgi:hypothetical protein
MMVQFCFVSYDTSDCLQDCYFSSHDVKVRRLLMEIYEVETKSIPSPAVASRACRL